MFSTFFKEAKHNDVRIYTAFFKTMQQSRNTVLCWQLKANFLKFLCRKTGYPYFVVPFYLYMMVD